MQEAPKYIILRNTEAGLVKIFYFDIIDRQESLKYFILRQTDVRKLRDNVGLHKLHPYFSGGICNVNSLPFRASIN